MSQKLTKKDDMGSEMADDTQSTAMSDTPDAADEKPEPRGSMVLRDKHDMYKATLDMNREHQGETEHPGVLDTLREHEEQLKSMSEDIRAKHAEYYPDHDPIEGGEEEGDDREAKSEQIPADETSEEVVAAKSQTRPVVAKTATTKSVPVKAHARTIATRKSASDHNDADDEERDTLADKALRRTLDRERARLDLALAGSEIDD